MSAAASSSSTPCIFCRIAAGEIPARRVLEEKDWVAFEDSDPKAPTHVLVVPRAHIATLNDLEPEQALLVGRLVLAAKRVAEEVGIASTGYRLVWNCLEGAGQSVFHIHLHVLGGRRLAWPPG